MRLIPIVAAVSIGLFARPLSAKAETQAAPLLAFQQPAASLNRWNRNEVKRDNTGGPRQAPRASTTGGKPAPVIATK